MINMGCGHTHVAIIHGNKTFSGSLMKVLNHLGFSSVSIKPGIISKNVSIVDEGQKQIHDKILKFLHEGILILDTGIGVSVSQNNVQDLVGWFLYKKHQIPVVFIGTNYGTLSCPTCKSEFVLVSYPEVELTKLLSIIYQAPTAKSLPPHNCLGIALFNPKRHNTRLRNYIRRFAHNELKGYVPDFLGIFCQRFCVNLWREFYGKILINFSEIFNAFHFHSKNLLPQEILSYLYKESKTIERILVCEHSQSDGRIEDCIHGKLYPLLMEQLDRADYEKDPSVLDYYDEDEALRFAQYFDVKATVSSLKQTVTQLQESFRDIKQFPDIYWQCRYETELLLLNLDVAPAFYFVDAAKILIRDELIDRHMEILRTGVGDSTQKTKRMLKLEETYQRCMEFLTEFSQEESYEV